MIDLHNEKLVPLRDLPKFLPAKASGKRLHISVVYRWVQRGVHGVRLEVVHIGGTSYTSFEALQRFASPLSAPFRSPSLTPLARKRQIESAVKRLDELL